MNSMNLVPLLAVGAFAAAVTALALWAGARDFGPGAALRRAVLGADRWLTGLAMALASLALAVAAAAGMWQVVARFATETPSIWSEALVRTALVWMAFLGMAVALRQGALVSIDVAHRFSGGAVRRAVEAASLAASLGFMGVLFWFGWTMAERVRFQEMAGLEVSMSWGYAALPIGAAFAVVGAVANFLDRRSDELGSAV